jgi:hypothetical protein
MHLALEPDELAIVIDALEADMDDYVEAAKEAKAEGDVEQATDLAEAALRVQAVLQKAREASNDS